MIEKNTNTIPATGGGASRTLKVERSVYGPDRVFLGTRDDLDGRQIGAHLIPSEARELVEALKPYADPFVPATVIDEDGDVWVEQEDGLFFMVGSIGRTATLAEIEESYGIDDGAQPEIVAIGSQVYVTGDREEWGHTFPIGTLVEVRDDDYLLDGSYFVRAVEGGHTDYVGGTDLSLEAPRLPLFEVGDKVEGSFAYGLTEGEIAHVVTRADGSFAGFYEIKVEGYTYSTGCAPFTGDGAGTFSETGLTKVEEPEPEVLKAGDLVRVREHYTHFLTDGSLAEVVEGGPETYVLRALEPLTDGRDAGATQYVGAASIVEPEPLQVGDRVRLSGPHWIANTSRDRTYDEAPNGKGSTGEVTGTSDVWGEGASVYVRWDGGATSVIAPVSLTKVVEEPLAEWERELLGMAEDLAEVTEVPRERFYSPPAFPSFPKVVLGIDPSVQDWSEIMKGAIWQIPEEVEVREVEPIVPVLEVGDRVQVIDATGSTTARLSDEATVEHVVTRPTSRLQGPLVRVVTDDGRRYGMFASRFEKVIREVWEPQEGDRVVLVEEEGDGSSAAKEGDLGVIVSIDDDLLGVRMDDGHTTHRFAHRWNKSEDVYCRLCGGKCAVNDPVR